MLYEVITPAPMLEKIDAALPDFDVLILSDYAKGALTAVQSIIQLARKHNVPVLIDPKGSSFEKYRGATLIKPNMLEFEIIVGKVKDETDLIEKAQGVITSYSIHYTKLYEAGVAQQGVHSGGGWVMQLLREADRTRSARRANRRGVMGSDQLNSGEHNSPV